MKKYFTQVICILIFLQFSLSIQAQTSVAISQRSWLWANRLDGSLAGYTNPSISADKNGNTYVAGSFIGTLTFPTLPSPTQLVSTGDADIFIVKYDASGNVLWAKRAGGIHADIANAVKYDGFGNIYVVGYFIETAEFGGTTLTNPVANSYNVFIAKYSAATGALQWVRHGAGSDGYSRQAFDVAVDLAGDAYITGELINTTTFAPLATLNSENRWWDIFVVKYSSSGIAQWQTTAGSTDAGYNGEGGNGIAVDQSGNVFVTGYFNGSPTYPTQFGDKNLVSNGGGGFNEYDYFLAKYNPSSSSWEWAVNGGSTTASNDQGKSVSLDVYGNPFVSGIFSGTATFGTSTIASVDGSDYFVSKYTTDGNLTWIHPAGGIGYYGGNRSKVDADGNFYFAGTFDGIATVGNATITSTGFDNCYIANWNSDGIFQGVKHIPGSYYGHVSAIDIESNGKIDFLEVFAQNETFDCTVLSASGIFDLAMAKLGTSASDLVADVPTISTSANIICSGANTTLSIVSGNLNNASDWKWYTGSCGGTLIGSGTSIIVNPTQNTTYYVRGEGGCAGPGSCASIAISINNTAPVINSITAPIDPVAVNTPISLNVSYTGNNVTQAAINWGDGGPVQIIVNPASTFSTLHSYSSPGVNSINVTLTDACGHSGTSIYQYVVNYDYNGGFVTGGGWINSPVGAYRPDITLSGKATFGFESKYQKGATVPSGNTEFKFQAGGMVFKSTSFQWLVIAGSKAQFKGTGAINNNGNYGFLLSAVDGNLKNPVSPDLFRIKIWDKNNGDAIVYDNQYGATEDAALSMAIAGGSIIIHNANASNSATSANSLFPDVDTQDRTYDGNFKVKVSPTPSTTQFTIKVYSDNFKNVMNMRVIDIFGRLIEERKNISVGQALQIGNNYSPGVYFVEITQGNNKKQLKLIKL